jgi:ribosome modulation factor
LGIAPPSAVEDNNDAYWEGMDVSDNPYEKDTDGHRSWEEGWRAARKDDYAESEG